MLVRSARSFQTKSVPTRYTGFCTLMVIPLDVPVSDGMTTPEWPGQLLGVGKVDEVALYLEWEPKKLCMLV